MTDDPARLLAAAWARLAAGAASSANAARLLTLATVGTTGWPEVRTVVLRRADPTAGTLDIHTDLASAKVKELAALPRAALHVWDAEASLQIRLHAEVAVLSGPDAAADWARVPGPSRLGYGVRPPPGTPIPAPLAYDRPADPAAFAVLRCRVVEVDLLHLGERHRRARFRRADDWRGDWLAP